MLTRLRADDHGMGLILVIGISIVVFLLAAAALTLAANALQNSRIRTDFELSLAAAEQGIDTTLAQQQSAYDEDGGDFPIPGLQSGSPCQFFFDFDTLSADPTADEVRAAMADIRDGDPDCLHQSEVGDYQVLKPPSDATLGKVYAVGWSPSIDAPNASSRMIKVEYQFLPFSTGFAVLTSGDLELQGSITVQGATLDYDDDASAHTNEDAELTGGAWVVTGGLSSTGNPGGDISFRPSQQIPDVSALSLYRRAPSLTPELFDDIDSSQPTWRDLCYIGGQAKILKYSENGPCDPTADEITGISGLTYDSNSHVWEIGRNAAGTLPAVYYPHEADISAGNGNPDLTNMTLIAAAENPEDCGKSYGSIDWDHYDIAAPTMTNLFMVADSDIKTHSNFQAGQYTPSVVSGMFIAGDQVHIQTSSSGIVGSVLAAGQCDTSPLVEGSINFLQGSTIRYDPNGSAPFGAVINQLLWTEE